MSKPVRVTSLKFASAGARKEYLAKLRDRLFLAGYNVDRIMKTFRDTFPPGHKVYYVFGRDDAERAFDVADEVRGVEAAMFD